ncbi:MAG: NAD-dependent epimerase/dehydratase family protein [Pseudomonadota bacterium]|nr:NAD-dependent epimerase/dehydratase family protein [Pseudomonadota bacterium]
MQQAGQVTPTKNETILVTGSAGFIGGYLLRELEDRYERVMCMYRNRLPHTYEEYVPFYSDLLVSDVLAAPLRNVQTVVHLAWSNNFVGSGNDILHKEMHKVFTPNLRALNNLIAAMERARTPRLIFLSVKGAHCDAMTAFAREKYIAEHYILNSRIPQKIIIRCPVVWEGIQTQDKFVRSVLHLMRVPGFSFLPKTYRSVSLAHVDKLAAYLVELCSAAIPSAVVLTNAPVQEQHELKTLYRSIAHDLLDGKHKLIVGGAVGDAMLPFLERNNSPKVSQYLSSI